MVVTTLRFNDPHLHERTKIEEEILVTKRRLQDLVRARNGFLPIATLPEDVLCKIFEMAKILPGETAASATVHNLTRVCRYWRNVALGFANLWVDVTPSLGKTWFHIHLERSKQANLSVVIRTNKPHPDITNQLVSQFHRVSHLDLRNHGFEPSQDPILTIPAPALRSLDVEVKILPDILFSGVAPLLNRLSISHCIDFRFSAISKFSTIIELKLAHLTPSLPVIEFFTNICSFLHLQKLWILGMLEGSADGASQVHQVDQVNLPELRLVVLQGAPVVISSHFLSHIPIHNELEVQVTFPRFYDDNYNKVYSEIILSLHALTPTRRSQLILTENNFEVSSTLPNGTVTRLISLPSWVPWDSFARILDALPVEHIKTFKLSIEDVNNPMVYGLFSRFRNVEELEVVGPAATSFMSHVSFLPGAASPSANGSHNIDEGAGYTELPFRRLRRLVIEDIRRWSLPSDSIQEEFFDFWKSRKESGIGLEELIARKLTPGFRVDLLAGCADIVRVEDERKEDFWMSNKA